MGEVLAFDPAYVLDPDFNNRVVELVGEMKHEVVRRPYSALTDARLNPELRKLLKEQIQAAPAVLLLGSPAEPLEHYPLNSAEVLQPDIEVLMKLFKELADEGEEEKRLAATCLGHHALVVYLGGRMIRAGERDAIGEEEAIRDELEIEDGICEARIATDDPIFEGIGRAGDTFPIATSHWASVDFDPADAPRLRRLASSLPRLMVSSGCKNAVLGVNGLPIYSWQFHPEGVEGKEDSEEARAAREVGLKLLYNLLNSPKVRADPSNTTELPLAA